MLQQEEPWERVFFYELGIKYDRLQQYQLAELFYRLGIYLFPNFGLGSSLKEKLAALARVEYLLGKRQQARKAYLLSLAHDEVWRRRLLRRTQGQEGLQNRPGNWREPLIKLEQGAFEGKSLKQELALLHTFMQLSNQEREEAVLKLLLPQKGEAGIKPEP